MKEGSFEILDYFNIKYKFWTGFKGRLKLLLSTHSPIKAYTEERVPLFRFKERVSSGEIVLGPWTLVEYSSVYKVGYLNSKRGSSVLDRLCHRWLGSETVPSSDITWFTDEKSVLIYIPFFQCDVDRDFWDRTVVRDGLWYCRLGVDLFVSPGDGKGSAGQQIVQTSSCIVPCPVPKSEIVRPHPWSLLSHYLSFFFK